MNTNKDAEYSIRQNPNDHQWYVMGRAGTFLMPISSGYATREQALERLKKQSLIDRDAKKCVSEI